MSYLYSPLSMRSAGGAVPDGLSRLLELLRMVERTRNHALELNPNPWAEPPEAVVKSGMTAVLIYFDDLYSSPCSVRPTASRSSLSGRKGQGKRGDLS